MFRPYLKSVGAKFPKVNPDYDPEVYKQHKRYDMFQQWGPFEGKRELGEDEIQHPLLPGAMRGDGAAGFRKRFPAISQSAKFAPAGPDASVLRLVPEGERFRWEPGSPQAKATH